MGGKTAAELPTRLKPSVNPDDFKYLICPWCAHLGITIEGEYPVGEEWKLFTFCENCRTLDMLVLSDDEYGLLDHERDAFEAKATEAIENDLRRLKRANQADWVEVFVDALNRGKIIPEDF